MSCVSRKMYCLSIFRFHTKISNTTSHYVISAMLQMIWTTNEGSYSKVIRLGCDRTMLSLADYFYPYQITCQYAICMNTSFFKLLNLFTLLFHSIFTTGTAEIPLKQDILSPDSYLTTKGIKYNMKGMK